MDLDTADKLTISLIMTSMTVEKGPRNYILRFVGLRITNPKKFPDTLSLKLYSDKIRVTSHDQVEEGGVLLNLGDVSIILSQSHKFCASFRFLSLVMLFKPKIYILPPIHTESSA